MPMSPHVKRRLGWLLFLVALLLPLACDLTAPAEPGPSSAQPYVQRLPLVVGPPTTAPSYPGPDTPPADPAVPPQASVRVNLQADRLELPLGEMVTLTAEVLVDSPDCRYPLYEISLQESTPGQVAFITPQVIGPPGQSPVTFAVRPQQAGPLSLFARAYGELDCGQGLTWQYYTSEPLVLQVGP
jgi:hypothetical protein